MALIVFEEVALDTLSTNEVINALSALFTMEVLAVVTLILANFVIARLASLLLERQVGREDKDSTNESSHDPKAAQVFHSNI